MPVFDIEEETQLDFECRGSKFTINVGDHKFTIDDIGEASSSGKFYDIYHYEQEHVCGAHGFEPWLGDTCDGCQESNRRRDILHEAYEYIVSQIGLRG